LLEALVFLLLGCEAVAQLDPARRWITWQIQQLARHSKRREAFVPKIKKRE
jgi:hypothetical protein